MKKSTLIKMCAVTVCVLVGLLGFSFSYKSGMQTLSVSKTPARIIDASAEIAGFKSWTKVNEEPARLESRIAIMCDRPAPVERDEDKQNPHNDKYINVYVNDAGKNEMLTKKNPRFPVGTIIVKEKLPTADGKDAELLTVMIKREKDYNPQIGDWEFLTFNGAGTQTTSRGKLQNCQTCHLVEQKTDYVSRRGYFTSEQRLKFK